MVESIPLNKQLFGQVQQSEISQQHIEGPNHTFKLKKQTLTSLTLVKSTLTGSRADME